MSRRLENTFSQDVNFRESDIDFLSVLKDQTVVDTVKDLIKTIQSDDINRDFQALFDLLSLLPADFAKRVKEVFIPILVNIEKLDPPKVLKEVEDLESYIVRRLEDQFSNEQWDLFLKGVCESYDLTSEEITQLVHHLVKFPNQKVKILSSLYVHDVEEWQFTEEPNFLFDFYAQLKTEIPNSELTKQERQWVYALINFLIYWLLNSPFKVTPEVLSGEKEEEFYFEDGEIDIPETWLELHTQFSEELDLEKGNYCEALVLLGQVHQKLVSPDFNTEKITKIHLELEPVQIYLQIIQLRNELVTGFEDYQDEIVSWMQRENYVEMVEGVLKAVPGVKQRKGSVYEMLNGYSKTAQILYPFSRAAVREFGNIDRVLSKQGGLESVTDAMNLQIENLILELDAVVPETDLFKKVWNEWYQEFRAKSVDLQERQKELMVRGEKAKKMKNVLDDDDDEKPKIVADDADDDRERLT